MRSVHELGLTLARFIGPRNRELHRPRTKSCLCYAFFSTLRRPITRNVGENYVVPTGVRQLNVFRSAIANVLQIPHSLALTLKRPDDMTRDTAVGSDLFKC